MSFVGQGKLIKNSNILLDFTGENHKTSANFAFANGSFHRNFEEESCYLLKQEIPIKFNENHHKEVKVNARLLEANGKINSLNIVDNKLTIKDRSYDEYLIKMVNKVSKVELLGDYLRKGEFKKLFNLVGVINQSDPNQKYLKDAEKVYSQRYLENKNIKNLYSILICQILQKKVASSEKTINSILDTDFSNGNAQLVKAIINVYLLDKEDSRLSLNNAKISNKSKESEEIINFIDGLTNILELKFFNAYKLLT